MSLKKNYGENAYLEETMKYSQPEFYVNFMQTHHFPLLFYVANIKISCIYVKPSETVTF